MSDEVVTIEERGGFSRRDLIKKAAVAGGVAWVAPTVLASEAGAVTLLPGGCTAKCGPTNNGTFTGMVSTVTCEQQNVDEISPNWHPAFFSIGTIVNSGSGCGCGSPPQITISGTENTFHVGDADWTHGTGVNQHVAYVGRYPGNPNPNPNIILANIKCSDRAGHHLCRQCELIGIFYWTWMNGPRQSKAACESQNNGPFTVQYQLINCQTTTCCP